MKVMCDYCGKRARFVDSTRGVWLAQPPYHPEESLQMAV